MVVTQADIDAVLQHGLGQGAPPPAIADCPICYNNFAAPANEPVQTPCAHWICKDCITRHLQSGVNNAHRCPYCRADLVGTKDTPILINDGDSDVEDDNDGDSVALDEIFVNMNAARAQGVEAADDSDYQSGSEDGYDSDEDMSDVDDDSDDDMKDVDDEKDSEDDEDPDGDYEP